MGANFHRLSAAKEASCGEPELLPPRRRGPHEREPSLSAEAECFRGEERVDGGCRARRRHERFSGRAAAGGERDRTVAGARRVQELRRHGSAGGCRHDAQGRRNSCASRRERRGKIDADQDSGRRLYARRGPGELSRRRRHLRPAPLADRLHPSGPRPHRLDDGGRKHLHDARLSAPPRHDRPGSGASPRRGRAGRARRRHRSRHAHPESEPHRKVAGGDRPRARGRARDPRPRRANRELAGRRGGSAVLGAAPAAGPRRFDDLRLAPPGRSVRDRRSHDRAARRARRRRAGCRQDDAGRDHPFDRGARALAGVPPAARAPRLGAARPAIGQGGGGRTDRLPDPFRRDRRPCRAEGRGAGKHRARFVRGLAGDRRADPARRKRGGRFVAARGHGARDQSRLRRPRRRVRSCRTCRCARTCSSIRWRPV